MGLVSSQTSLPVGFGLVGSAGKSVEGSWRQWHTTIQCDLLDCGGCLVPDRFFFRKGESSDAILMAGAGPEGIDEGMDLCWWLSELGVGAGGTTFLIGGLGTSMVPDGDSLLQQEEGLIIVGAPLRCDSQPKILYLVARDSRPP